MPALWHVAFIIKRRVPIKQNRAISLIKTKTKTGKTKAKAKTKNCTHPPRAWDTVVEKNRIWSKTDSGLNPDSYSTAGSLLCGAYVFIS